MFVIIKYDIISWNGSERGEGETSSNLINWFFSLARGCFGGERFVMGLLVVMVVDGREEGVGSV